jgi:hypothetical protein
MTTHVVLIAIVLLAISVDFVVDGLQIAVAGGTGKIGRLLLPKLIDHDVTVLTRNSFLASAPNKVTEAFGYLGEGYLRKHRHVSLRDWDGGDMLEIVGKDFIGWQDDALKTADVILHLCGGFTEQREMVTERLVRESLRLNRGATHIVVNPREDEIKNLSPGMLTLKTKRINKCEKMVSDNCFNSRCLRVEAFREEATCQEIFETIQSLV